MSYPEITEVTWYPRGTATALDVEAFSRGLGFTSTAHFVAVLEHRAPSAFEDEQTRTHRAKRAA